jgi:hypothetical protein
VLVSRRTKPLASRFNGPRKISRRIRRRDRSKSRLWGHRRPRALAAELEMDCRCFAASSWGRTATSSGQWRLRSQRNTRPSRKPEGCCRLEKSVGRPGLRCGAGLKWSSAQLRRLDHPLLDHHPGHRPPVDQGTARSNRRRRRARCGARDRAGRNRPRWRNGRRLLGIHPGQSHSSNQTSMTSGGSPGRRSEWVRPQGSFAYISVSAFAVST